jgi:tetratricopeptide (TPR) repeat protein
MLFWTPGGELKNSSALSPATTLEALVANGKTVFVSPEYIPLIPDARRSLMTSPEEAALAMKSASEFLKLNRKQRFTHILLSGSPSSRTLLDSLSTTPLWVLADVEPWGYLFAPPGATPWTLPSSSTLEKKYPRSKDRTLWMIGTAGNLAAINHWEEAGQLLDEAEHLRDFPSLVLGAKSSIAASQGRWQEAMTLSRQALAKDPSNSSARETLVRSLIECGRTDDALDEARTVANGNSENQQALFLLARAANASGSNTEEIEALEKLTAHARRDGQPLGVILTYLGQANAKMGRRGDALRAFQLAVVSPELSTQQRAMIREIMDHIMVDEKPSTTLPDVTPEASPAHSH